MVNDSEKHLNQLQKIIELFRKGKFEETYDKCIKLIDEKVETPFVYNLLGMAEIKLNHFNDSINSFKKAIKLNKNFVEAYNNMASSLINLGRFKEAIDILYQAIKIRPDYPNAYNNIASAYNDLGNYEEALKNFNHLLKINPDYPGVKQNIIKILSFYNPTNPDLNEFTKSNYLLKNYKFEKKLNYYLSDEKIIKFYKDCSKLITDNFYLENYNFSQIWRRNSEDLNCTRHFDVFNNFNVIPEFCFSCFKVQVELNSIFDLFRLYFIFDTIKLKNNKIRKCLVELRSIGSGSYKGIIYCNGFDEAKFIENNLFKILNYEIKNNLVLKIRRGCTEFGISYPDYKNLDQPKDKFMKYNKIWKEKEDLIDKKIPKENRNNKRNLNDTLKGICIGDFLTMRNWIMYAKTIGDNDYKKFDKNIVVSEYIKKEMIKKNSYRSQNLNKN